MSDNDKGPALEESIEVDLKAIDSALEDVEPIAETEQPAPDVTITFTGKEFEAVSRVFVVELMLTFPELFFSAEITEEGRMAFAEMAYRSAVYAVHKFTTEEAVALRKKFADTTLASLRSRGVDAEKFIENQMALLSKMGFDTKITDGVNLAGEYHGTQADHAVSTETVPLKTRPAEGDTPPEEAQRGSEPEPGQS